MTPFTAKGWEDYTMIVLGMAVYAIGFSAFILPHHIVVGGMAGFGTLVYFATGGLISIAATMYVCNILMLVCWYKTLGRKFVTGTIFGATVLSVLIGICEGFFNSRPPLVTDPTMSVLMGAALCGLGIGMYFSHHGSAGGTDIVAAVVEKKRDMSMGRTMMIIDVLIVACSFFLPFDGDMDARIQARVQTIIYGWVSIVIYSFVADRLVYADKQTIQFTILSDRWKEITDRIMHETGRGATSFDCVGEWTGQHRRMLIVWCRKYNAKRIYEIILSIDPGAYMVQTPAISLYGNGFDRLKPKKAKNKTIY